MKDQKKKKRTMAFHKGEGCLRDIIERSVDGIVITDKKGIVRYINPAAETFFGKKSKTFLGGSFGFPLEEGKSAEIDVTQKDGKTRIGQMRVFEAEWDGKPAFMASVLDITEHKQLERLKDEFISTVSHELRTPMTTIREAVSQVLDGILGETTNEQREFLSVCLEDIDRLKRIIDNLLEVAMMRAGAAEIRREEADIAALAEEACIQFYDQARDKGLEIKKVFPKKNVEIYADKKKIVQIFANLISNAIKFTKKGWIEVGIQDKGQSIECYVSDTGAGISGEDLPRVFGKFRQFGRISGSGEQGTGLGLFIAKGITELHRGKIAAESKLNEGSKFTFTLPKYSVKEILYDSIAKRIAIARKTHEEFSVFVVKLNDYSEVEKELGKEKAQEILSGMSEIKNISRDEKILPLKDESEIVVITGADRPDMSAAGVRLKRAVKEFLFETSGGASEIGFSCGRAVYPADAGDAEDLFKKAEKNLISEKEERLKKKIMIVDDERKIVESLHRFLEKFGYSNITEAYDGTEALERIASGIPDLVILDMMMPEMNGYEVIGRLKEDVKTEDIPVLIMSGYEVEVDKLEEYIKKKVIPAVTKPIDMKEFRKWVDFLL
jgi:signal transduction histidine kinase/GGDEF domain-containing protein